MVEIERSLVIGASGLVGSALMRQLGDKAIGTVMTGDTQDGKHLQLDITNERLCDMLINSQRFDTVYLAGGISNVDQCEIQPKRTSAVNVFAVRSFIEKLPKYVKVVFFSSGSIFDGEKKLAYSVSDIDCKPINEYGMQKLEIENYISINCDNWCIIRPVGVFGKEAKKKNFAYQIVRALTLGNNVHVPKDQQMNPIHSDDLAKWSILAVNDGIGIYHIAGDKCLSKYDFAVDIAKEDGLDWSLIIPTESSQMRQPALRPKNGCLEVNIGVSNYRQGLRRFFLGQ